MGDDGQFRKGPDNGVPPRQNGGRIQGQKPAGNLGGFHLLAMYHGRNGAQEFFMEIGKGAFAKNHLTGRRSLFQPMALPVEKALVPGQLPDHGPGHAKGEIIQAKGKIFQAFPGMRQPAEEIPDKAGSVPYELIPTRLKLTREGLKAELQLGFYRYGQLGRGRWGRGPEVRHEIRDGEIRFMAHGGDHRNPGGKNGPGGFFRVKSTEVFQGSAAPGDDGDVRVAFAD